MSRNIPIKDETYDVFSSIKEATGKLINNKRITNDVFIEMLIKDFSLKDKALSYLEEDTKTIKKLNDGNNGHKVK